MAETGNTVANSSISLSLADLRSRPMVEVSTFITDTIGAQLYSTGDVRRAYVSGGSTFDQTNIFDGSDAITVAISPEPSSLVLVWVGECWAWWRHGRR